MEVQLPWGFLLVLKRMEISQITMESLRFTKRQEVDIFLEQGAKLTKDIVGWISLYEIA